MNLFRTVVREGGDDKIDLIISSLEECSWKMQRLGRNPAVNRENRGNFCGLID